jgi:nucleoside-diphosphate-sugar epimerase
MRTMRYAIFGASGGVGKELAALLASEKENFRVVGRSGAKLRDSFKDFEPYVEYCEADLAMPEGAGRAAEGVDTVFYTLGVPYTDFARHPVITANCVAACARAGVKHYVHLSTLYSYGRRQADLVSEDHPREPHTFKGRMRKKQEDIVLDAHREDGMKTAVLCPPDFYGGDSDLSHTYRIFQAAIKGGTADVIGPLDVPHEFVYVPDLADTLLKLSRKEEAYGSRWNLAGAGRITIREFAEKVFALEGRKPKLRSAGRFMLRLIGLFNPVMKEFAEMYYLMDEPLFVDDTRLRALIPDLKKTSYDEGIRETLALLRRNVGSA